MSSISVGQVRRRGFEAVRALIAQCNTPLPRITTTETQLHAPTIYFCQPDFNVASGGVRVAYRHVDVLNEAGIRAAVLHRRRGFRCTWFENQTHVVHSGETRIGPEDLVVLGELNLALTGELPAGFRFVVFNQGPYLTWKQASAGFVHECVSSHDLAGIVTVSSHSKEFLEYAAPRAKVLRVHNSIDPTVFFCSSLREPRTIAYMPRRGRDEARQVFGILHSRGSLRGWRISALEGMSERRVADEMRRAVVFLSFGYQEGFGLPAAEAMACGSYVVGFHGFGGREIFRPEFSSPVPPGDVLKYAQTLERVIEREVSQPGWCRERGEAAARFISAEYSPSRERHDVVAIYSSFLRRAAGAGSAIPVIDAEADSISDECGPPTDGATGTGRC